MRAARSKLSRHAEVGKAMNYMLKRWDTFSRFLNDGRICMSNNAAERVLRGVGLGRKAWLFCGSDRGGERAAVIYTLIVTAKLNGVDPRAWLADVLRRIADHPASRLYELLPWNWNHPLRPPQQHNPQPWSSPDGYLNSSGSPTLKPAPSARRVRDDVADDRKEFRFALDREQAGEYQEGEKQVHGRPCSYDCHPGKRRPGGVAASGTPITLAWKGHEAASRKERQRPLGSTRIPSTEQSGTYADCEPLCIQAQ